MPQATKATPFGSEPLLWQQLAAWATAPSRPSAACGLGDSLVKALGRWSSAAYQVYIKIPPQELAAVAPTLVANAVS